MRIQYLDGKRFSRAIRAASLWLIKRQQRLNDINVYPVPDSDTGTNMASTMRSISERLREWNHPSIGKVSEEIAESALNSARGNSGAILAQFFQGLAEGLRGKFRITTHHFSEAVHRAIERSYEALSDPREGTILTVIREWGEHVRQCSQRTRDFFELFQSSLEAAKKALEETPKRLKVLSKAGVVDAGAQGFVYMLEGILHFIQSGRLAEVDETELMDGDRGKDRAEIAYSLDQITHRYCTEFFLYGNDIPLNEIRQELSGMGDSVIVAGSAERVRIHIHTDNPRDVFDYVRQFGEIRDQKMDDMFQQHYDAHAEVAQRTVALVTDTSCDLPEELIRRFNIHMVPLRMYLDGIEYIDKVTIHPDEFYDRLINARTFPKTSQPTPKDFLRVYQSLEKKYEHIISVHLAAALSGTFQSAQTAARQVENAQVHLFDARTTSVALGMIMVAIGEELEKNTPLETVLQKIPRWIDSSRIFVSTETVEYLVRGGRISKGKGFLANLLNLRPVITLTPEGKAKKITNAKIGLPSLKKVIKFVFREADKMASPQFAVVHVEAPETAEWYRQRIEERYGKRDILVMKASPVLGAHAGPGAAAVAVMDREV
jgi:hypothetical protein